MSRRGLASRSSPLAGAGEAAPRRMRALVEREGAEAIFASGGLRAKPRMRSQRRPALRDVLGARDFGAEFVVGAAAAFGEIEAARFTALDRTRAGAWREQPQAHALAGLPDRRPRPARRGIAGRLRSPISDSSSTPTIRACASPLAPARPPARMAIAAVRDDATRWAALLPKGDGVILHVSGCAKGCARPAATAVTSPRPRTATISFSPAEPAIRQRGAASRALRSRSSSPARREPVCWREANVKPSYAYEKDAAAIYRRSFAIIRGEADLARFSPVEERVAVRVIHACGMVEAASRPRLFAGRRGSGARGSSRRRADLLRRAHGGRRGHARPSAREQ